MDANSTTYLFDGDHIVAEYETGALSRKFVHGPGIDEPLMLIAGENRYFYHANEQGSVLALSNAPGALAETYLYSPYGELGFEGAFGNPYLYTGRRYDPETGLYYYRARMSSAAQRRFLQPDPIGYAGGMNMYAYVGNNPVMYVDPWGLADINLHIPNSANYIVAAKYSHAGRYIVSGHGKPQWMYDQRKRQPCINSSQFSPQDLVDI